MGSVVAMLWLMALAALAALSVTLVWWRAARQTLALAVVHGPHHSGAEHAVAGAWRDFRAAAHWPPALGSDLGLGEAGNAKPGSAEPVDHMPNVGNPVRAGDGVALFHQLADALPQLVSIMQADGARTYVNQRWADYTGVQRGEILKHSWRRFIHADDLPVISAVWLSATSQGAAVEFEYRLLRADGQYRWMLGRAAPLAALPGQAGHQAAPSAEHAAAPSAQWLMTSTDIDDLKRNAEQLEKSVTIKRLAGRIARLGGWSLELPQRSLQWSDETCRIYDLPIGHLPNLEEALSYFDPEHRVVVQQHVNDCVENGTPYDFVLPMQTATGRHIWVRGIAEAVRHESGKIARIQGALQDVTEQKLAELRTQALEVQLTATMNSITDGFYLLDHDWRFTYLNATAEAMFKRHRDTVLGHTLWQVFPDKAGTRVEQEFKRAASERKTCHFDAWHEPLATWFDVHVYPMGSGLAVYLQDITQKRADQAQLRLLQTAVARLNDTVVIAEAGAGAPCPGARPAPMPIVFVNDAFERGTGYSGASIMGTDFSAQLHANLPADERARVNALMAQFKPVRTELAMTTPLGAQLWLEVDVAPMTNEAGVNTHLVAVARDVTERRQHQRQIIELNGLLQARVQQRTAQLMSANKELESFAYAVSHDLRSPLNTIAGFMPLLLRTEGEQLSERGRRYLSRVSAGVNQMGQLIAGLLTLAHMSREQPRLEMLDLTAMAQRAEAQCRSRQPERPAHVTVQPGMRAEGDVRLLETVLDNLIGNAWKFSAREPIAVIDIGSYSADDQGGGESVFFVKDNGVGFDMAFKHKLFGTFERLHSPGEFEGTGIGLATVKRVIANHGGRIWAESTVGEGATFYFTLGSRAAMFETMQAR